MGSATRLVSAAGRHTGGVVLVPATGIATAAWLANRLAGEWRDYLVAGALAALAGEAILALFEVAALSVVWLALCDLPARRSMPALRRGAGVSAAHALLIFAFGGWLLGLPGTFGVGPVDVGWVTVGTTTVLLDAATWTLLQRRRTPRVRAARPKEVGLLPPPATASGPTVP